MQRKLWYEIGTFTVRRVSTLHRLDTPTNTPQNLMLQLATARQRPSFGTNGDTRVISGIITSFLIFLILTKWVCPEGSRVPALILTLMLMSSMKFTSRLTKFIKPPMSQDRQSLINAIAAFENYVFQSKYSLDRKLVLFKRMPLKHRQLAENSGYLKRHEKLLDATIENGMLLQDIATYAKEKFSVTNHEMKFATNSEPNSKVVEILDHLLRDWTKDSKLRRDKLFEPIMKSLKKRLPAKDSKILLPGAGLCRLAVELTKQGYQVDAIEWSAMMDIVCQFMMDEKRNGLDEYTIRPYIHEASHQVSGASQLTPVTVPDEKATTIARKPNIIFGDFTQLKDSYDALVTLFFIDTAENVFTYLDHIARLVKPGGLWINYGPLLWGTASQAELTMEELREVIEASGDWQLVDEFQGENVYKGKDDWLYEYTYKIRGWAMVRKDSK